MSFSPYIGFAGNARVAIPSFAKIFGAQDLQIMTFAEMPAQFSVGPGAPLMGCDIPHGMGARGMSGSSVFHAAVDAATASRIFGALSADGEIVMAPAPMFW